jgi:hypothetical protein
MGIVSVYGQLSMLAKGVARGTTANGQECPFCGGGRTHEKAMSITVRRDGTALFLCHRASCGRGGRIFPNGYITGDVKDIGQDTFTPKVYKGRTRQLTTEERAFLEVNYGFTYRELNFHRIAIDEETGRVVTPIVGPNGQTRGYQLTNLPTRAAQPKAITYRELNEPFNGWFWTDTSSDRKIVLVEDTLSAMRVARQFYAVALLSTNLSTDCLLEVLKFSDHIILALDRDATGVALRYKEKYKFIAPQLQVVILERDLKWLPDAEIREKINI